jgi:succinoglycan biosynthesis protein ExoA
MSATDEDGPRTDAPPELPGVSVIMPVLNEERHLSESVAGVLDQRYAGTVEIVLALGPSSDRTGEIAAELAARDPRVRTVANPTGRTPNGLNLAVAAARHDVIVRVDGHSQIPPDYLATAVRVLDETGADNVGGLMNPVGQTPFERAVACAMTSRIGVGGGSFHVGGGAGPVDTVYLGCFRRSALDRVGGFDEHFTRTQDWQLNHRIRASGGVVWFTPELAVNYRPRPNVRRLARQYFEYGRWRRVVARHHPETVNPRYLAAPVMVTGTTAAAALGLAWRPALAAPAAYLAGVTVGGLAISRGERPLTRVLTPVALAAMHWSWGIGFLTSPRSLAERENA